jgi:hypothetical protein
MLLSDNSFLKWRKCDALLFRSGTWLVTYWTQQKCTSCTLGCAPYRQSEYTYRPLRCPHRPMSHSVPCCTSSENHQEVRLGVPWMTLPIWTDFVVRGRHRSAVSMCSSVHKNSRTVCFAIFRYHWPWCSVTAERNYFFSKSITQHTSMLQFREPESIIFKYFSHQYNLQVCGYLWNLHFISWSFSYMMSLFEKTESISVSL